MSSPKYSVIVPVYNTQSYIEGCVKSVLSQSYGDFELILVDDGSTDSSGDICDRLAKEDDRIRVIHQPNTGHITARINGVNAAEGEWILLLDSDDEWLPELLSTVTAATQKHGCDMLIFRLRREDEICRDFFYGEKDSITKEEYLQTNLAETGLNSLVIKVCRRELFENVSIEQFRNFKNSEDMLLSIQLVKNAKKISYITDVLYYYRLHDGSITNSYNESELQEFADSRAVLWKELEHFGIATAENRRLLCNRFLHRAADSLLRISRIDCTKAEKFGYYGKISALPMFAEAVKTVPLRSLSFAKGLRIRLLRKGMYRTLLVFDKIRNRLG